MMEPPFDGRSIVADQVRIDVTCVDDGQMVAMDISHNETGNAQGLTPHRKESRHGQGYRN
jgi:hypothetical protein